MMKSIMRRCLYPLTGAAFVYALSWSSPVQAQPISGYTFSQSVSPYTAITGGTILGDNQNGTEEFVDPANLAGGATANGPGFPIGFNFSYNNNTYDRLAVSADGWISLGKSALGVNAVWINSTTAPLSSTTAATPDATLRARIAGMGLNIRAKGAGSGSDLRIETIGTTPNQVCVVQFTDYERASGTLGANGDILNFQIRLYETTNVVEIHYGSCAFGATITTEVGADVGLSGTVVAENHVRETLAPFDWNTTTLSPDQLGECEMSSDGNGVVPVPVNGRQFIFTPPNCSAPTATASQTLDCVNGQYSITVDITDVGNNTSIDIETDVNGVEANVTMAGMTVLGPFALGTPVTVTLTTIPDAVCSIGLGTFTPTTDDCPNTTYPYCQNFDAMSTCGTSCGTACPLSEGWTNATGETNETDWTVDASGTTSTGTGPSDDFNVGGNYLYIEATSCTNRTAQVISRTMNVSSLTNGARANFYYHIQSGGSPGTSGTLTVEVEDDANPGTWVMLGANIGPIAAGPDTWIQTPDYDFTPTGSNIRYRITGTTNTAGFVDMAIDEFCVNEIPACMPPIAIVDSTNFDCGLGTYNVYIDLQSIGDAATVDINSDALGTEHDDVSTLGPYVMGPYPMNVPANITVVHGDPVCDLALPEQNVSQGGNCPVVNSYPYCEGMDTWTFCDPSSSACTVACTLEGGWTNSTTDDADWRVRNGSTVSSNTGPTDDVPGGGQYAFIETSTLCGPRVMFSPDFSISAFGAFGGEFSLYYHMFDNGTGDMGDLTVEVEDPAGSANFVTLFSVSGDQGNQWNFSNWISLAGLTGPNINFRVTGTNPATFNGDIAVDEFCMREAICIAPTVSVSTPQVDCGAGNWTLDVDVSALGDAPPFTLRDSVQNGASNSQSVGATGVITIGPYALTDTVLVDVFHSAESQCDLSFGPFVVDVVCSTAGTCDLGLPIPNADCVDVAFPITTTGTGLGVDITLESVDIIVNHPNNGDIDAFLTSPNGVTVPLISDNFGVGDSLGNSANCPTDVLRFIDGGAPLTTTSTNLVTGSFQPDGNLADFSDGSDPNGAWILTICDDATGANVGELDYFQINFINCAAPEATTNVTTDCGASQFSIEVDVTSLGSATTIDIEEIVNAGTPTTQTVGATGVVVLGPFTLGDNVEVNLIHDSNNACDVALGTFTNTATCLTQGVCDLGIAIPDAGCAGGNGVTGIIPVTFPGTALGTDVLLGSVDIIITHTFNADLEVSLTSPNGVTVSLIADRFSSGDSLGNNANCPTDVLRFIDGGAALTTTATNNVVGDYQPEDPLANFNDGSDPNGDWILFVCDDAGGDLGELEYIQLNLQNCTQPEATTTVVLDCANNQFSVDVDLTALGALATDVDILASENGGADVLYHDDVSTLQVYTVGPFAAGSSAAVTILHNQDPACDVTFPAQVGICPISTYPYCETFDALPETNNSSNCFADVDLTDVSWTNAPDGYNGDDNGDWYVNAGTTVSTGGPSTDNPNGPSTGTGNYLYMEASGTCNGGDDFIYALSPEFDVSGFTDDVRVNMAYHMFGATMGTMSLEVEEPAGSDSWTQIWTQTGDQGDTWFSTGDIDFAPTPGNIRFRVIGVSGSSFNSDMAFDDFCVTEAVCDLPQATATVVSDCGTTTFTINVDLTSLGDATDVDIVENVNGGGAAVVHDDVSALQVYALGPYVLGTDVVEVTVRHNGNALCDNVIGSFTSDVTCTSQGTCGLGLAIPDAGCPSQEEFAFSATAPGTMMGTDVLLQSVDLIVSHTFNADLEIALRSPSGVVVGLISDNFGGGDSLGNNANCPTDVIRFIDGGAALTTTATSNVVGDFQPDDPIANFADGSDPNGDWTLLVCDDAGGDLGEVEYIQLNFITCAPPTATATVVEDCANNQFTIDVDLTALGTAPNVDITADVNGGGATVEHDDVSALQIYSLGPYPDGTSVDIEVLHNVNSDCDLSLGNITFVCPPTTACGPYTSTMGDTIASTLGTQQDTITISGNPGALITDLDVVIEITHTFTGDLDITLTSPTGTIVNIINDQCGSDDDLNVRFNDEAAGTVDCAGTGPVFGEFQTSGTLANLLSTVDGEVIDGDWTLSITDDSGGDEGNLIQWCLIPQFVVPDCPDAPSGLSVTGTTASSATLNWTPGATNTGYSIEYGPTGFTPGSGLGTQTGALPPPVTVMGLPTGTELDFYLTETCPAGNALPIGPVTASTLLIVNTYPYCETFDGMSTCGTGCGDACPLSGGWINSLSDDIDWTVDNLTTVSSGTGPNDDVTGGGNYLYTESSTPCFNATAVLLSPEFDISSMTNQPVVSFGVHMFGDDMGSLTVEVEDPAGSSNFTTIYTQNGALQALQADPFEIQTIPLTGLTSSNIAFRVTGVTGPDFESDMAIDEFCVVESPCFYPEATVSSATCTTLFNWDLVVDLTDIGPYANVTIDDQMGNVITGATPAGGPYTIATYGNNTTVDLLIFDPSDPTCTTMLSYTGSCAPPPTDDCSSAPTLPCGITVNGTLTGFSNTLPTTGCPFLASPSLGGTNWWQFTDVVNQEVTLSMCNTTTFDSRISVFSGPDCNTLTCVAFNDNAPGCASNSSEVVFPAEAGVVYYIAVHGVGGATGDYSMSLTCGPECTPASGNDICPDAAPLVPVLADGTGIPTTGDNSCAYADGNPACDLTGSVQGVWYTFNTGLSTQMNLTLLTNNEDAAYTSTQISYVLFDGACTGNLTAAGEIDCQTDAAGLNNLPALVPMTDYLLLVYNSGGIGFEGTFGALLEFPAQNDAAVDTVNYPNGTLCTTQITPEIVLQNLGEQTLTDVVITYQIDADAPVVFNWTGSLPYLATEIVELPTSGTTTGAHSLTVTTSLPNGVPDEIPSNDSYSTTFDASGEAMSVVIMTDNFGTETTWEIYDAFFLLAASGGPYTGQNNTLIIEDLCLPTDFGNCFFFFIYDDFGDGICCGFGNGFWELRNPDNNVMLRDIFEDAADGSQSPSTTPAGPGYFAHEFCLPTGPSDVLSTECNIFTNNLLNKVYTKAVPGVTDYQFEFSDPDWGFIRRIAVPRNFVRFSEMVSVPLQFGETYFCRVRVDQGFIGSFFDDHFGTGCEMGLDANPNICTELIDNVGSPTHSCGVTKEFMGSDKIYAIPVVGGTQYRFLFTNAAEGYARQIAQPSYVCWLHWFTDPLQPGVTYDVDVEVLVNGQWSGFCGATCQVTIQPSGPAFAAKNLSTTSPEAMLWPNPVMDDHVQLALNDLSDEQHKIVVDVYDLFGKRVLSKQFANEGAVFNTVLELNEGMASGTYLVHVMVNNDHTFVERLNVQ